MRLTFPVCIALDSLTLDLLDAMAKANGRSRSSMMRWLIRQAPHPVALKEANCSSTFSAEEGAEGVNDD